jgi:hypothetical protein
MHSLVKPFTRRATLAFGLCVAMCRLSPVQRLSARTQTPENLQEMLLRWSRTATGFADLQAGDARAFMEMVLGSGLSREQLSDLQSDSYRGTALEKRLLEAWYTGVFGLTGSSGTRSFETTLMWRAAGLNPPPSICDTSPERWASAP